MERTSLGAEVLRRGLRWEVPNGVKTFFRWDTWLGPEPLYTRIK